MNLADITTKCYILALIIRDDGERLLLGDGAYEFKDSQQHFIANTYANDVVELQGTDGQMLAGQVRRTAVQTFAGYIGDATFSKQRIEKARRDFLMFFRKKHYYTAVYVFSDGTAIQRDRGYIVNAPSAPELYQRFPEWSIGLNFEDPNYYEYAEDDLGHGIAAHKVELELSTAMSGGLIWDEDGAVSDDLSYVGTEIPGEGKNFQLADTGTATLKSAELLGDATQTTYSGKNLFDYANHVASNAGGLTWTLSSDGVFTITGTLTTSYTSVVTKYDITDLLEDGTTYTISSRELGGQSTAYVYPMITEHNISTGTNSYHGVGTGGTYTFTVDKSAYTYQINAQASTTAAWGNTSRTLRYTYQLEKGSQATDFEKFVGGVPAPNPEFPQTVNTVTGEQTVRIEGKNLFNLNGMVKGRVDNGVVGYESGTSNLSVSGDTISFTTTATYRGVVSGLIPVKPSTTYSFTATTTANSRYVDYYDNTGAWISRATGISGIDFVVTTPANCYGLRISFMLNSAGTATITKPQLELGSTATAYEPYQGQSLTVNLGKNLADITAIPDVTSSARTVTVANDTITISGNTNAAGYVDTGIKLKVLCPTLRVGDVCYLFFNTTSSAGNRNYIYLGSYWAKDQSKTITQAMLDANVVVYGGYNETAVISNFMITKSSDSTYASYFTPIELAKIGSFEDRIYKTGGKWYIEKQVGKITEATNFDNSSNVGDGTYRFYLTNAGSAQSASTVLAMSSRFVGVPYSERNSHQGQSWVFANGNIAVQVPSTVATTLTAFRDWWSNNPTTIYYALATPTTTEITNSELVGQLERLRHAHTYADTTNFSITATSPNLPAFLKVVAFGDDATPQGGYVWEDGGTGGATIITVDGVDNAQPIWTVVGPATNPSLTNITTGESIQWTGVVPNGQTLVVNMADMTASLSGANVFEFISGSWITLQAGNNRVSYSATAATGIATLEWNGVVG